MIREETDRNDFLTEKNKKAGVLGKLKWVLCGFCILLSLGAIGASEKYIGEGRWGMAATEILLCLLFLYPTFREIQKAVRKKNAREIACWFESYAQNTVSFEKLEQELGKSAVKKLEKFIARGYIRNIQIDREGNYIMITAPNRRVNEKIYTDDVELSQHLLFGDEASQKSYTVKEGDTISSISEANKLNPQEFLIANPKFKSVDSLLALNDTVNITLIQPLLTLTYQLYSVEDVEQYFEKTTVYDKSKPASYSEITQPGINGITRVTSRYAVINGEQSQGILKLVKKF